MKPVLVFCGNCMIKKFSAPKNVISALTGVSYLLLQGFFHLCINCEGFAYNKNKPLLPTTVVRLILIGVIESKAFLLLF